jgi:hypothetical protein
MGLETYEYLTDDNHLDFEFYSEGPKGKIRKIVRYRPGNSGGITYFNLGFGDWNPATDKIDDLVVTNNRDKLKVLATIALTVLDFTQYFPDAPIYVRGSTPSRTRLYQIGISLNWNKIDPLLYVYGYGINGRWQRFQKNMHYRAFLIKRK